MSDDDSPDNVLQMPRIGSPPPPPVPPPPALGSDAGTADPQPDTVRISAFDAPAVPHAPRAPASVPAALRSDGLDATPQAPAVPPPRTSVLSLAAVLAIALAAFEGLQSWIQESGPRRAEAAKHQRELELLAAKAGADAARLSAEVDKEHARARRVPSSHDYGRNALGRGSGGSGRGGGGIGPGRSGTGRTAPNSGLAQGRSTGSGSRGSGDAGRSGTGGKGSGSTGSGTGSGRGGAANNRNGGSFDRSGSPQRRNGGPGGGSGSSGSGGWGNKGTRGGGGTGSTRGSEGTGGGGRRSPRQAFADWWGKGKKSPGGSGGPNASGAGNGPKSPGGGAGTGTKGAAGRGPVKGGPTFWDDLKNRVGGAGRVKPRRATDGTPPNIGGGKPPTVGPVPGSSGTGGDRVHLKDAAWEAVNDRWKKRRSRWTAEGDSRHHRRTDRDGQAKKQRRRSAADERKASEDGRAARADDPGQHWYDQPRSSPFDRGPEGPVVITVEQVDPPGAHAKRWEPTAIAPKRQALPAQSQPALPRAPQRPAGQRPGTTRRKEPIPMPPVPARTAGVPTPVTASVPAPGGMSAHQATDITLDDVLKALTLLTTEGMETHDDCAELARHGEQLLSELESMAADLATEHNVTGPRTLSALSALMESVGQMTVQAKRMARAALNAAELSEAEETAMARDYRPTQDATADAGLVAPSARIHNEN